MLERAEAAPYVNYPKTPGWYSPAVGLWMAALIGAFTWWRVSAALFVGSLVALVALEFWFITWLRRRHGAMPMPGHGTPPREIGAIWVRFFVAVPVVVALIALAWWLGGVPAGAGTAFVLVTAGLWYYERRYAAAAAEVRKRLG